MTKKKKEEEETNLSVYNMLKNISLEVVTRHLQDTALRSMWYSMYSLKLGSDVNAILRTFGTSRCTVCKAYSVI